jgi:cell division protein FtsB
MTKHKAAYEFDNRDSAQVFDYMEARIEALKRRVAQLETENETLRGNMFVYGDQRSPSAN